jgi:predicted ferric reductase
MSKRAMLWICLYLLLVAAPLATLMVGPMPPGREFWWDFSKGLGFAGLAMFGIQFALTARFRRASAPFGIDIVYFAHKYLAWTALCLVFVHWAIIWLFYPEAAGPLNPLEASWEMTAGRAALGLFALAVVTSQWRETLGLEYGLWRYSHVAFATLGFILAAAHAVGIGYYTQAPQKLAIWLALTLGWIGLWMWLRLLKPWGQKRRPYKVVELRKEGPDTWTLALEPDGHAGMESFKPGQFAWLTLRHSPYTLREHPFSISSAPEQLPRLEFTIKALGDFSATIGNVVKGERAFLDGPFGAFSPARWKDAPVVVMIAGGVGITPMMSIARSHAARGETRPLILFFANKREGDILFRKELEQLPVQAVHIIAKPSENWQGESGFLDADILDRHLPREGRARFAYFLCGPPPMMAAVEAHLAKLGIPGERIEQEIFNLT